MLAQKSLGIETQLPKALLTLAIYSLEMQIAAHITFLDYLGSLGLMALKPYLLVMLSDKYNQPRTLDICRGQKDKQYVGPKKSRSRNSAS